MIRSRWFGPPTSPRPQIGAKGKDQPRQAALTIEVTIVGTGDARLDGRGRSDSALTAQTRTISATFAIIPADLLIWLSGAKKQESVLSDALLLSR